jgi:hypothetical protein
MIRKQILPEDQYAFPNQLLFLAMMEPWVESQ